MKTILNLTYEGKIIDARKIIVKRGKPTTIPIYVDVTKLFNAMMSQCLKNFSANWLK